VKKEAFSNSLLFGLGKLKIGGPHVLIFCGGRCWGDAPSSRAKEIARRVRPSSTRVQGRGANLLPLPPPVLRPSAAAHLFLPLPSCRTKGRKEVQSKSHRSRRKRIAEVAYSRCIGIPRNIECLDGKDSCVHWCISMLPMLYWLSPCLLFLESSPCLLGS